MNTPIPEPHRTRIRSVLTNVLHEGYAKLGEGRRVVFINALETPVTIRWFTVKERNTLRTVLRSLSRVAPGLRDVDRMLNARLGQARMAHDIVSITTWPEGLTEAAITVTILALDNNQ